MHFAEKHKIPGLLMLIDFEKAFDSVSWKFLYSYIQICCSPTFYGPHTQVKYLLKAKSLGHI